MRCIENEALRVQVCDLGAELSAVYDKTNGRDVLWTADPAYWDRHAPILFPFVGRVYKNIYRYDGKEWPMTQHGFARDLEFECIACTETTVTHRLCADEKSKTLYPFDYVLTVTHRLEGNTLHVEWLVENKGEKDMYFSIGGHPGFLCPVLPGTKQTDYFIYLPDQPEYVCKSVDVTTGTIFPDKDFTVAPENGRLPITEHTFDNDALVFDDNQAKTVGILYPDGKPYITMHCPDFPSLGIWSKPNNTAPFVCLEPWTGRCDNTGYTGDLQHKYGVQELAPGAVFTRSYSVTVE